MKRTAVTALIAVSQLALVGVAVAPQLSARVARRHLPRRVAPLDPIDPFRGAYVALDYPDLRHDDSQSFGEPGLGALDDGEEGDVYVTLVEQDGVWAADEWTPRAPRRRALPRLRRPLVAGPVRDRELLPPAGRGPRDRGPAAATAPSPRSRSTAAATPPWSTYARRDAQPAEQRGSRCSRSPRRRSSCSGRSRSSSGRRGGSTRRRPASASARALRISANSSSIDQPRRRPAGAGRPA